MATTSQAETKAANLQVYRDPEVVSHYAELNYLTPCERLLFETYIEPGMKILDIGVGGGRTTPYLSDKASRYIGVDYSAEMIRTCRNKFPHLEFEVADASDLSAFADASFDAVVISFNGIDCLVPEERRWQCLRECSRVLRAGGVFIFSSHNPRSVFLRPSWSRDRLRAFTARLVPESNPFHGSTFAMLTVAKAVHSFLRATGVSVWRIGSRLPKQAFWRGEGYVFDPAHGGLMLHCAVPGRVREELSRFDFRPETLQGDDYPSHSYSLVTDWYYYVFSKAGNAAGELCA
jgi:ubiquinone/menaquinone biosynthesis C-methylase UbiE